MRKIYRKVNEYVPFGGLVWKAQSLLMTIGSAGEIGLYVFGVVEEDEVKRGFAGEHWRSEAGARWRQCPTRLRQRDPADAVRRKGWRRGRLIAEVKAVCTTGRWRGHTAVVCVTASTEAGVAGGRAVSTTAIWSSRSCRGWPACCRWRMAWSISFPTASAIFLSR